MPKISWENYFLGIARDVAKRSSCQRKQNGAVIVKDHDIIATGYNGTPAGVPHCDEGACPRCEHEQIHGVGYPECICVHDLENAIIRAARQGVSTRGSIAYDTGRPCLRCLMMAVQAGIKEIFYIDEKEKFTTEQERLRLFILGHSNINLVPVLPEHLVESSVKEIKDA